MKRILAILCVIACLCGLCVPAMAAGTITVSVKAPADWAQVYLYVWDADGNPMEGWPGSTMSKSGDLWTLEIPAGAYTNVIANNGGDTGKTPDLKMDGSADCWIDAGAGVVYTDAGFSNAFGGNGGNGGNGGGNGGVNLGGLNSLALVGSGIPGVAEWNPGDAAGDMTKVSDGVYTKVIAVTAGAAMTFKIAGNDAWDDNYNFGAGEDGVSVALGTKISLTNGGGSKDITFTPAADGNVKFTVDLNAMTVLVETTTEEPSTTPVTPPVEDGETYTVYAKVPADWKSPSIWCWNDSSSNPPSQGSWPGTYTMTKGDDGWYAVEIPVGYNNLLINANGGGVQTPDIVGCGGQDVWINAYTDPNAPVFSHEPIPEDQITDPTTAPIVDTTIRPTEGLKPSDNTQASQQGSNKTDVVEEVKENDITVLLIVIGSVVVLGAVVVVFVVMKKKQNKA